MTCRSQSSLEAIQQLVETHLDCKLISHRKTCRLRSIKKPGRSLLVSKGILNCARVARRNSESSLRMLSHQNNSAYRMINRVIRRVVGVKWKLSMAYLVAAKVQTSRDHTQITVNRNCKAQKVAPDSQNSNLKKESKKFLSLTKTAIQTSQNSPPTP